MSEPAWLHGLVPLVRAVTDAQLPPYSSHRVAAPRVPATVSRLVGVLVPSPVRPVLSSKKKPGLSARSLNCTSPPATCSRTVGLDSPIPTLPLARYTSAPSTIQLPVVEPEIASPSQKSVPAVLYKRLSVVVGLVAARTRVALRVSSSLAVVVPSSVLLVRVGLVKVLSDCTERTRSPVSS